MQSAVRVAGVQNRKTATSSGLRGENLGHSFLSFAAGCTRREFAQACASSRWAVQDRQPHPTRHLPGWRRSSSSRRLRCSAELPLLDASPGSWRKRTPGTSTASAVTSAVTNRRMCSTHRRQSQSRRAFRVSTIEPYLSCTGGWRLSLFRYRGSTIRRRMRRVGDHQTDVWVPALTLLPCWVWDEHTHVGDVCVSTSAVDSSSHQLVGDTGTEGRSSGSGVPRLYVDGGGCPSAGVWHIPRRCPLSIAAGVSAVKGAVTAPELDPPAFSAGGVRC